MLVLRSLVPAGFMLAPVDGGGLAIVLCDADATAVMFGRSGHDRSAAAHDVSMPDMPGHDMSGHPGGHTHPDPTCPFAQSSGATPLPFLAPITPAIAPSAPVLADRVAQIHAQFGPLRQQSPRGPPRFA